MFNLNLDGQPASARSTMMPYPPNRVIAGVITALIALCCTPGKEARAQQAGSGRGARTKAVARPARSQPKEENEQAREFMEDGLSRAERKDWAGALEAFGRALAISPRYGNAYIAMGDTYMTMGEYEEGFKAYRQAISVAPSNPAAHYSLGAAYNDMAQYGDAFRHFVQAIRLDPGFAEAHYGIGYAYLRLDNFREALIYLRRAAHLWPDSGEVHLALGQTYLGLSDVKAAERELKILAGLDAAAADDLEKEIGAARDIAELPDRDVAKPPDRAERGGRAESAPPAVEKSVAPNTAQEKRAGSPARPAAQSRSSLPAPAPVLTPRPAVLSGDAGLAVELSFWESVKNSGDPEEFAAYLNKYPEGQFAELARIRMRALVGKKGEAAGGNSRPPPPPADDASAPDNLSKPGAHAPAYDGIAQQPKEQLSEEQPAEEQPAKEQPKEQPAAEKPRSSETGDTADAAAALDSLRRLLPANFSYQVRTAVEASAGEAATLEVKINYEPLKFEGCTVRWRDQNDALWVSLPELDPEAVRVEPRSRPDTTLSIEVWNVSISAVGGKDAINEAKGDGSGTVNRYNRLDLQYDLREKAERLAGALRQAIRLCAGKP
jgi:tetratricopeptide (TPR) repeat protein